MNDWLGRNVLGVVVGVVLAGILAFILATGWSINRREYRPATANLPLPSTPVPPPASSTPQSFSPGVTPPISPPPPRVQQPPVESAPPPRSVGDWLAEFERERER